MISFHPPCKQFVQLASKMGSPLDTIKEMFPTRMTAFVFVGYMALFVNLGESHVWVLW